MQIMEMAVYLSYSSVNRSNQAACGLLPPKPSLQRTSKERNSDSDNGKRTFFSTVMLWLNFFQKRKGYEKVVKLLEEIEKAKTAKYMMRSISERSFIP